MSEVIDKAISALNAKLGDGFDGVAKFVVDGEGAIMVDAGGARAGDEDAAVTLTADADTFQALLSGDLDPAAAFMGGRLAVEGDMGLAMRLGAALG